MQAYARRTDIRFCWKTWRDGAHWHASMQMWKDGKPAGGYTTSLKGTEQEALDRVISLCMENSCPPIDTTPVKQWRPNSASRWERE